MITLNVYTFWGIAALAAMGLIQAAVQLLSANKDKGGFLNKPEAPDGFEWVLMTREDAAQWRESQR